MKVPTKILSSKAPDSEFSGFSVTELPGFLFVDHIAIAVCAGELEAQLKMYLLMGFRELHREEWAVRTRYGKFCFKLEKARI